MFALCAQGQHERKIEYGVCGIITAIVCLPSSYLYDFMVSTFLGFLPVWSSLSLVSPFIYNCPSCLSHLLDFTAAWTRTSNVHAAVYRYLINKYHYFPLNRDPTSCTSRLSLPILLIYPVFDVPNTSHLQVSCWSVPYLVLYGLGVVRVKTRKHLYFWWSFQVHLSKCSIIVVTRSLRLWNLSRPHRRRRAHCLPVVESTSS